MARILFGVCAAAAWLSWTAAAPVPAGGAPVEVSLAWSADGQPYRVDYVGSIAGDGDLAIRRNWFARLVDVAIGEPSPASTALTRPFTVAADPAGRLLVSDPGLGAVHVLDPQRKMHKVLRGPSDYRLRSPIGVDADAAGQIYVADSATGRIFVFDPNGAFVRFIGARKNEGYFKRPTGLAIDRSRRRIYLTDTLHHTVYVVAFDGTIERSWGTRGEGPGEFNYPTAVTVADDRVFVLDALNFRVQVFTPDGALLSTFGRAANEPGGFFRPKALTIDPRSKLVLVVDAMFEAVQAFTYDGGLVWVLGHSGSRPGEFNLPAGICVHPDGRLVVADSYNRRLQLFRLRGDQPAHAGGGR